ncbi:MAG TPA: SDR family oxidoreductase [Candidatus Angelobacter sp.]|nr:SDR family oxidoreductase [Candidatus Angelobacter sp.]
MVNLSRDLAIELAPGIPGQLRVPGRPRIKSGAGCHTEMRRKLGRSLGQGDAGSGSGASVAAGYATLTQNRPLKRVAKPAEIANAILFLASDLASFRNGAIGTVDGGVMAKAG